MRKSPGAAILLLIVAACGGQPAAGRKAPPLSFSKPPASYSACAAAVAGHLIRKKDGDRSFNGSLFCTFDVLGAEGNDDTLRLFVQALVQEYYMAGDTMKRGFGALVPCAVIVACSGESYTVMKSDEPAENESYGKALLRLFPKDLQKKVFTSDNGLSSIRTGVLDRDLCEQAAGIFKPKVIQRPWSPVKKKSGRPPAR
jgi:hypothetical protein